jgi:hypothetical protein
MNMVTRAVLAIASMVALLGVAGCGGSDAPQLMNMTSDSSGPDEFLILPSKPLETPENYTDLPVPTPGGVNRTDPTPQADAIAALGGSISGGEAGSSALMAHTGRFGVQANIRQTLAQEDLEWRRANNGRFLERAFNVNVYFKAYEKMTLDQYAELERWRAAGYDTPSAPPDPAQFAQ